MNGNLKYSSISLEITSRCRLECQKCSRTYQGKNLKIFDMTLETFNIIVKDDSYKILYFNGVHGDCIYHPKFLEFIRIAKENKRKLIINTNGSGKSIEWWHKLFSLLQPGKDTIHFAMDGFKETVGIYRVNFKEKDFEKNIEIMSIGKNIYKLDILWVFIPMKFNEHQIQQAATLAVKNNIIFMIKKSYRWYDLNDPLLPQNSKLIHKNSYTLNPEVNFMIPKKHTNQ
jgi:MoaA/NifB/PqqE/SkfB family radical SAM enzyme